MYILLGVRTGQNWRFWRCFWRSRALLFSPELTLAFQCPFRLACHSQMAGDIPPILPQTELAEVHSEPPPSQSKSTIYRTTPRVLCCHPSPLSSLLAPCLTSC